MLRHLIQLLLLGILFCYGQSIAQSNSGQVFLHAPTNETDSSDSRFLRERMAKFAQNFNLRLRLPRDIFLTIRNCGFASANYNRATGTVTFCKEMIDMSRLTVESTYKGALETDDIEGAIKGLLTHIFLHEIGHALLDGSVALGKPEDNADLIAVFLTPSNQVEIKNAIFGVSALHRSRQKFQHYGALHAPSDIRRANLACWYFGKMPTSLTAVMAASIDLPESRKQQCSQEYSTQASAVKLVLESFRITNMTPGAGQNETTREKTDASARYLMARESCTACHAESLKLVGPSWQEIFDRRKNESNGYARVLDCVKNGCRGNWSALPMPAQNVSSQEAIEISNWLMNSQRR